MQQSHGRQEKSHGKKQSTPVNMPDSGSEDLTNEAQMSSETKAAAQGSEPLQAMDQGSTGGNETEDSQKSASIGSMISQSLAKESQATIDSTLAQVSDSFQAAKKYTNEKPVEAALIACTAGLAAWVLLGTKPGRKVFDVAAARFVPEVTAWASKTFKASLQ